MRAWSCKIRNEPNPPAFSCVLEDLSRPTNMDVVVVGACNTDLVRCDPPSSPASVSFYPHICNKTPHYEL